MCQCHYGNFTIVLICKKVYLTALITALIQLTFDVVEVLLLYKLNDSHCDSLYLVVLQSKVTGDLICCHQHNSTILEGSEGPLFSVLMRLATVNQG